MNPVRVAGQILVEVLRRVLVDPVRTGRLRRTDWPSGLTTIVLIGLTAYVLALAAAVLAGPLRDRLPHDSTDGFPPALLPAMIMLVAVVVALGVTGCLHAPWSLRLVGLLLPLVLGIGISSWSLRWWSVLVQLGCWLVLVAFAVWRWRRSFAWWEFVVVQALIGTAVIIASWLGVRRALDGQYLDVTAVTLVLLASVAVFALPTTLAAGMALSELAFTTSLWVVETVSVRVPGGVTRLLTALLALITLLSTGWVWWRAALPIRPHLLTAAFTAAVLAATGLAWIVADRLADRRGSGSTRLHQLVPEARTVSIGISVLIALPVMVSAMVLVGQLGLRVPAEALGWSTLVNGVIGFPEVSNGVLRGSGSILAGAVAVPLGLLAAARDRRGIAELTMVIAVLSVVRGLGQLGLLPVTLSLDDLSAVAVLLTLALVGVWAVRGRLTDRRVEAVAVGLAISLAVSHRELLADPLSLVLGGTGGVLLAFGLVWALLTGAADANDDSDRFPRPARALLVVAGLALTMTVYAFNQLVVTGPIDLDGFVREGADVLGTGLLLAGLWAVLGAAARDEEVKEPVTGLADSPQRGHVPTVGAAAASQHGQLG